MSDSDESDAEDKQEKAAELGTDEEVFLVLKPSGAYASRSRFTYDLGEFYL